VSEGYNVIVEADDDRDDAKAAEVARIICEAYPGHPWHVRIGRGAIVIKHMKISAKWGIARHYDRVTFDAKVFKHSIVMAAGEFLERAGVYRGHLKDGDTFSGAVEGVPQKDRVIH
jgi:hypothetical protein